MAITEEILRLRYEATGEERVANLRRMLDQVQIELDQVNDQYQRGVIFGREYTAAVDRLTQSQKLLEKELKAVGRAATSAAGVGRNGGFNQLAGAISTAAVMMDDLQYGSRNVANNLIGIGMMVPEPRLKVLLSLSGLLVSAFHRQIDSALGLGQAYKKAGDEAEDAAKKMETFGQRLAEKLRAESGGVQQAAQDVARVVDDLSAEDEGGLLGALLGTKGADGRIADLKQRIGEAQALAGNVGIFGQRRIQQSIAADLEEIQKIRAEAEASAKAELDKLIADVARGDEAARSRLEDLARKAGIDSMVDTLQKLSPKFAQAQKDADLFAISVEEAAKANKKLTDELVRQGEENEKLTEIQVREIEKRTEAERQAAQERARIREAEQNADGDVAANAFRGVLGGRIGGNINAAMARGASRDDAAGMAFEDAYQQMRRAGVGDVQAANAAAQLVEEQTELIRQQTANMDAILGMLVGQQRANTVGRRQTAMQANQIRRMQLMWNAQQAWFNNRPNGF